MTTVLTKVCAVFAAIFIPFAMMNINTDNIENNATNNIYITSAVSAMDVPETAVPIKQVSEPPPETKTVETLTPEPEYLPDIISLNIKLYNDHKKDFNQVDGKAYLNDIRSYLVKYAPEGMFISAACAQSYTEGGAGKAGVYSRSNNCFGIIAGRNWDGYCFSRTTQLVYKDYETAIKYGATDLFRAYDCIEDSVKDYVSLISGDYYKDALNTSSPKEYLSYILNKGYGGKESLWVWLEMIELYNLEEFDIKEVQE